MRLMIGGALAWLAFRRRNAWALPTVIGGSPRVAAYIAFTWGMASAVLWLAVSAPTATAEWSPWGAGLLLLFAVFGERIAVAVPNRDTDEVYTVSVATIPQVMCALLLPPALAAGIASLAMLIDELRGRRPIDRVLFNTASTAVSVGLTALIGNWLGLVGRQLVDGDWQKVLAVVVVAVAYYGINTLLVAGIGAVASRQSLRQVLLTSARFTVVAELASSVLGGLAAFVWMANPFWVPVGLFPVAIAQLTLRYIAASTSKTRQLAALDRLGRALSVALSTEQVFREATVHLQRPGARSGSFLILSEPPTELAEGLAAGMVEQSLRHELAYEAARQSAVIRRRSPLGLSWLAVPLPGSEQIHGCLGVVASQAQPFSSEEVSFFQLVAERVGLTLEHLRRADAARASEQLSLRRSEERFRSLVRNAGDVIAILDSEAVIGYQSPAAERVWGFQPEQLLGTRLGALVHPGDQLTLQALLARTFDAQSETTLTGELRLRRPDGSWRVCELMLSNLLDDPGVAGVVATFRDITERKAFETQLSHMALHDALSGLPNRALFIDRLEQALVRASERGRSLAVLFLDLDDFKVVNDSMGHQAGDQLLMIVSDRLSHSVRPTDTVARLGGDEFTVLLEDVEGTADALATAERISLSVGEPLVLDGRELVVRCSIGVAVSSSGNDRPETLLSNADLAMYRAKRGGKAGAAIFDSGMESHAVERLELETELRHAVERHELCVFYQPILSLTAGRIVEFEALIRWAHPERGLLAPDTFVPLAEETGLIVPIGDWILMESCRQLRLWQQRYPSDSPLVMSVNLSARQFQSTTLAEDIEGMLREIGLDPHTLKLEITESLVMQDAESAVTTLRALKALGIQLAIDDFGTGYSSLAYLKRFPVDTLKIDRSFVGGLGHDPQDTAIVRSVVALAKSLDLSITAEGIETLTQEAHLRDMGCERGQGYLFSRPVSGTNCEVMLDAEAGHERRRAAA